MTLTNTTTAVKNHSAYIALGSNLEEPLHQVERAISELEAIANSKLVKRSHWYRSKAIGPGDQPDYINGVALLQTQLDGHSLLEELLSIEQKHNRIRHTRWGPRTLDLDLLLLDNQIIQTDSLTVPHPRMKERNFVLYPLADLNPDLVLPCGKSINSLLAATSAAGLKKVIDNAGVYGD